MVQNRIGIDLGGTKIEGLLIDTDGNELIRRRIDTPQTDYKATLQAIADLVEDVSGGTDLPVGIGTPGSVSRVSPMMRNANSTCLNGQPLLNDLEQLLQRPVRIANDADCFTLSEAVDGAAKGAAIVFGVILGTGVGGGICIEGKPVSGVNGIAGEWGHNPMPVTRLSEHHRPRQCYCGRNNCVETWLCGEGLAKSYRDATQSITTPLEIARLAASGDRLAKATIDNYAGQLAAALSIVINILDPDVIVLGGGLSNIDDLYELVPKHLPPFVFSDHIATEIKPAKHGDSSGVRGAAWLWPLDTDFQ